MIYDLGLRLKDLREQKDWTQGRVGGYLGVTGATVCGYEKNTITPPIDVIRKLTGLFGVSADYLLGLENVKNIPLKFEKPQHVQAVEQIVEIIQQAFT